MTHVSVTLISATTFSIQYGNTALHVAATNDDMDIAEFLLKRGARININNAVKWGYELVGEGEILVYYGSLSQSVNNC